MLPGEAQSRSDKESAECVRYRFVVTHAVGRHTQWHVGKSVIEDSATRIPTGESLRHAI